MVSGDKMPAEFDNCVDSTYKNLVKAKAKPKKGTLKDMAYAICTKQFMKKHGISPAEYDKKHATSSVAGLLEFYLLMDLVRGK